MSFRDSMAGFSYEKRPLKRARLGPPDVYPQEAKQREDELTAINVKQGFSHIPQLSDEFGTAKNINLSATKLGTFINGTIAKKAELNALPDSGKRRLQVNTKDNFWPVTPRLKHVVDMYMKDLASTKSLQVLAKRVPIFNKREEIFLTLAEHSIPMLRAAWFLKMTASYNSAISEAKTKKRQMPDPTQEWTVSLLKCLKDILFRLSDWHNGGNGTLLGSNSNPGSNSSFGGGSSLTPTHTSSAIGSTPSPEDGNLSLRQWQYCTEFAKHLYEEGLLDRFDWLQWIIDACDRMRSLEDGGWKALVPLLLAFIPDIAQSELLARRLAHLAARRLSPLFAEMEAPSSFTNPIQPPATLLEHLHCPFHRSTILTLVSALQVIQVECPTAMVFNGNNFSPAASPNYGSSAENTRTTLPSGSPLDLIAVSPSALPMPPRANNPIIRLQLRSIEEQIRLRSRAVEAKWACEEWQQSSTGPTLQKVLAALECLDLYSFDKVENSNCIETLYKSMFATTPIVKENPVESDAPIVLLLCQWAVGPHRSGDYRALVVARLLEHRQNLVTSVHGQVDNSSNSNTQISESKNENMSGEEVTNGNDTNSGSESQGANGIPESTTRDSNTNSNGGMDDDESEGYTGLPIYHNLLFKYLDTDAPTWDDSTNSSKIKFSSLVHLFAALIRHDIFSHDTYLCTLVARGDLSAFPPPPLPPTGQSGMQQMQSVATPGQGPGSHAGPCTPASVSSTVTPGATPHHDPSSMMDDGSNRGGQGHHVPDQGPLFQPLPRLQETLHRQQDYDDRMDNIDDDLDRILRHITQEQQENMDQIDSPKEDNAPGFSSMHSSHHPPSSNSNSQSDSIGNSRSGGPGGTPNHNNMATSPVEMIRQSRHRLYVTHFPLPQDESYQHEANQRHILLYGVGRARDESKHAVKKISKDLTKLFTKKFCYDIADGSRVKKHSKNEISLESLQTKFMGLPYFDQHALTSTTASTVLEMLSSFGAGRSSCLPTVEHITFLTELMEVGLNVMGIIETTIQILRELPEVEAQLIQRGSPITGSYITSLQMQIVAILRRYHCSLLLDSELVTEAWEGLLRVMRRFTNSLDCTSAERCTLAYLTDLHASCNFLRSKNFAELLNPIAAKLRTSLCIATQPTQEQNYGFNNSFMTQCLDNPRRKVDPLIIRQLNENANCRYSFVSNAVLSICNEADSERLNDLASLCAEMTAVCPALSPEWLGVLQSLCSPSRVVVYADVLAEIDVKHLSIHSSLATLTAMLVARQCFTLQDIVVQAVPSLLKAWNESRGPRDTDTEAGARLTCYLLLSLFKTHDVMNPNIQPSILKLSSDRRLLSATHSGITLGAVLAALKAMLLLADAATANERRREQRPGMPPGELSISHILGTSDVLPLERNDSIRSEPRTLATFALSALQQMCAEPWVRQRCLRNPIELCQEDMLLDPIVSTKQAQRLLHLICYPELVISDEALEPRMQVQRIIMERLDQWNLREARVALTLQNRQLANNSADYQAWLDTVARSALEVFHLGEEAGQEYVIPHSATPSPAPGKSPRSGKKGQDSMAKTPPSYANNRSTSGDRGLPEKKEIEGRGISTASSWLVAPLIEKLSTQVQGRVLRHAGNVLENTLWPKTAPKKASGTGLHSHLPFLALILTCLRGQDEQRETLLQSLLTQFTQLLQYSKDAVKISSENQQKLFGGVAKNEPKVNLSDEQDAEGKSETLRDALRLRLSLVGGMFDAVQRSTQATAEWAVVLTQLVTHSVVDLNSNSDVFYTVVDMITALVHSTQVTEAGDRVEEVRKQNLNLIKKLKKELTDRDSESIKPIRQLLPFSRVFAEIVVTQSTSIIVDSKGNRVQSFEYVDKKPGLQVWEKQRVSPWEILEGQRHPAPLSWSWFGAVKMERKPLRYEEAHRLNKFHTHNFVKPFTHFLEPVPLPAEEIDLKPEIHIREEINLKPDTPISMMSDQSPRGPIPKITKPKLPRKKRLTKAQQEQQKLAQAQAAAAQAQQQQQQQHVPAQNTPVMANQLGSGQFGGGQNAMGGPGGNQPPPPNYQPGPPQWYNGQAQQQQPPPQQTQQPYYQPQPGQGAAAPRMNQSPKAALHSLLRARTVPPGASQFQQFPQGSVGPVPGPNPRHGQGAGILRQQLKGPGQTQPPGQMPNPGPAGFQAGPPNQNTMIHQQQQQQLQQQSQGINQNYGYNNQPGMNMVPGQQASGLVPVQQGPGTGAMMNPQQQQGQMQMMAGPRGPSQQDMNFMNTGNRPMGTRVPFMQGGGPQQQQQQQGMGGPMQPAYNRPNMSSQMGQGQAGGLINQIGQGNMTGQMQGGQMAQVQMGGQVQAGMQNQGGQMVSQGMGTGMPPNTHMNQMGQGMMNPGPQQQRMMARQQMMMQQQQQQQMGMRGPGQQMHYNPNTQGGY